ncbi:MAG TPA: SDR family NAD(P)-dependent oxidoreductase [Bacteroidota bacterium]|nr:SDR family NAD(P)-dependent oxidoreductase [Bacteroidota bacterium]
MEPFRHKNVLVTGGLGFIGSNMVRRLVTLGANVTIIDSMNPEYGGNLFNIDGIGEKVSVIIADVRDAAKLDDAVRGKHFLFNLAGQVSHIDSMTDPMTDMEMNVRGQLCVLECCRKKNPDVKIVFAGTRQVYGKPLYLPVDEKHPILPTDINGINKLAAEWYHIMYNNVHNIRACSIRMTNVYGPRQLIKHNRQGFIAWFIRQIVEGSEISIFGDGSQIRDFNYVDDVVDAMLLAASKEESNGQIFNLGADEFITLKELVTMLVDIRGTGTYKIVPFPAEKKRIDIGNFYGDYTKIAKTLGWKPKTQLKEGLAQTIAYYTKNLRHYLE